MAGQKETRIARVLNDIPRWARPGRFRYARIDGGPMEVAKGILSGWYYMPHPDSIYACANFYNDQTIDLLDQACINWIWVTWSAGFSLQTEELQRRILGPFIAKCHRKGIRVSAYHSLTNMFWEDMFAREPRSKGWIQVDESGNPVPYGAAYYVGAATRYLACLNNRGWQGYLKRRVDLALEAGVDAISYDNLFTECHCPRCQEEFKRFTRKELGAEYAIPAPRKVEISEQTASQGREVETLEGASQADAEVESAWRSFQTNVLASAMKRVGDHGRRKKPDLIVYCNAHQRQAINDVCNAMFTEDAHEPGVFDGRLVTNAEFYRQLQRQSGGWKPIKVEYGRRKDRFIPMGPGRHKLVIAEAAAFQSAAAITPEGWFVNGLYKRDKDALANWEAIGQYNRFLKRNEQYYVDVRPLENQENLISVRGKKWVLTNAVTQSDKGRTIIHLLNYHDQPATGVAVTISTDRREAYLLSPDGPSSARQRLKPMKKEGQMGLVIPRLDIYSLAIIE